MTRRTKPMLGAIAVAIAAALSLTAAAASSSRHQERHEREDELPVFGPGRQYRPHIEREDFSPNVTNPWFPLKPGRTLIYTGTKDGKRARNVFTTTSRTKVIDGVKTRVVFDRLFLDGKLAERTYDYYAQDEEGNVWYFGEDTVALDAHGQLTDTEGSFRAGTDGAKAGVFMTGHPNVGRRFRQEWYAGHAEDQFRVLRLKTKVTVPYGSFRQALLTEEKTALEPDVVDHKYFVRGIGEVVESSVKGPVEKLVLSDITPR